MCDTRYAVGPCPAPWKRCMGALWQVVSHQPHVSLQSLYQLILWLFWPRWKPRGERSSSHLISFNFAFTSCPRFLGICCVRSVEVRRLFCCGTLLFWNTERSEKCGRDISHGVLRRRCDLQHINLPAPHSGKFLEEPERRTVTKGVRWSAKDTSFVQTATLFL